VDALALKDVLNVARQSDSDEVQARAVAINGALSASPLE
jgi:hypothetical protein